MKTSDVLRKLVRACVDDEHTLRHESKFVHPSRVATLTRLASQRERFVADLERLAERIQPHDGSWTDLSREAERDPWMSTAGRNTGDAIASCLHSRARTEAVYDEALQGSWPAEMLGVIAAQRRRLHDDVYELHRLEF